ncbi:hypothetical protein Bbelb_042610 [Branchiostoma belcheri]|nr:hypothetical protein Bbelb_042610 [Branchiostoma belcheri]
MIGRNPDNPSKPELVRSCGKTLCQCVSTPEQSVRTGLRVSHCPNQAEDFRHYQYNQDAKFSQRLASQNPRARCSHKLGLGECRRGLAAGAQMLPFRSRHLVTCFTEAEQDGVKLTLSPRCQSGLSDVQMGAGVCLRS